MELVQIKVACMWLLMCNLWGYSQLWTDSTSLWLSEFKWAAGTFSAQKTLIRLFQNSMSVYLVEKWLPELVVYFTHKCLFPT